jgi:hypothetical protein
MLELQRSEGELYRERVNWIDLHMGTSVPGR